MRYPKILLVNGEPFGSASGLGITLSALLAHWPPHHIASLHTSMAGKRVNGVQYCKIRLWGFQFHNSDSTLFDARYCINRTITASIDSLSSRFATPCLIPFREFFRSLEDICPYYISSHVWNWIYNFAPDVVYSMLGNVRLINLSSRICSALGAPLIPHFMDDWIRTKYTESPFYRVNRKLLVTHLAALLRHCSFGFAISPAMAQEYERVFKLRFWPLMNCVNIPPPMSMNYCATPSKTPSLSCAYVGGLHLNRWRSLLQIGRVISHLKHEGYDVDLTVYAPQSDVERYATSFSGVPGIIWGGTLSPSQVAPVLTKFDVLVHVESFDAAERQYTRLSLSTKIPQYLASGRPILAYGPAEVASMIYLKDSRASVTVADGDTDFLKRALLTLLFNMELRHELGERGRQVALRYHDASRQTEQFRRLVIRAIKLHRKMQDTAV